MPRLRFWPDGTRREDSETTRHADKQAEEPEGKRGLFGVLSRMVGRGASEPKEQAKPRDQDVQRNKDAASGSGNSGPGNSGPGKRRPPTGVY